MAHVCQSDMEERKKILDREEDLQQLAALYGALGDVTRLKILLLLSQGGACVCDIAVALSMSHSSISHQLKKLRMLHLVKTQRRGKEIFYELNDDHIHSLLQTGIEHINE